MRTKFKTQKRILSVFLCVLILFSCVPMSVISVSAEDTSGLTFVIDTGANVTLTDTDADGYYDIGTADELYAFAYAVNGGSTSINGELTADIVVNEGTMAAETENARAWTPIGDHSKRYIGSFNGNSYTVSGLYLNNVETSYVGLFGFIFENGIVKNTGVINSYFNGEWYVGGLVGYNYKGTITNCYNTGKVNGLYDAGGVVGYNNNAIITDSYNTGEVSGNSSVGGVTGYNNATITDSYNIGEVSGNVRIGGMAGYNYGTITNCYNKGKVSSIDDYVGGIAGNSQGTVTNCYNEADISSTGNNVGGVLGNNINTITNCYNTGKVSGTTYVGGVVGGVGSVGNNYGTITNCYNTGKVSGSNYVGGVVSSNYNTLINCYNTGEVSSNYNVGGIAGSNSSTITNSYNTGKVSGTGFNVGGVAGSNSSTITNCYNTGTVCGVGLDEGGVVGSNSSTIEYCYYLSDSETDDLEDTTAKTKEQFESGEVAYLLQSRVIADENGEIPQVWGQDITTGENDTAVDAVPTLGGDKVYYGYTSCADGSKAGYTNNANATAEKPGHNWENAVCLVCSKACEHVWDSYSTCTICYLECKHKELKAEFTWDEPYEGECYVYMELSCNECGSYVTSDSGNVKIKESVEGTDCTQNGSELYEASFEYEGVTYTDTKEFCVKSENHTAMDSDGFCSACGGYESANYNEETGDYEISNAGQLFWYAQLLNEQNLEIYAKLTKDIVIPEDAPEWVPISCSYAYFDGNFKTISGLKCVGGEHDTYVGFFGNENWWYDISNLHITNSYFEGKEYVGAVAACMGNGGNVTNCYVTNTTVKGDSDNVGTLVGHLTSSQIINCYVDTDTIVGYHSIGYGSIENSYYLADEETDSYDGTTAKTAEAFASGEVAYLLQAGVAEEDIYDDDWNYIETIVPEVWGQKIGTDTYPLFGGDKIYGSVNCIGEVAGYSNTEGIKLGHVTFENGFCTACDIFEPATLNADGCYEIGNAGQLYWFADKVNNDNENFASANAILTANIVVNQGEMTAETENTRAWTPIGNIYKQYTGTFNGNNHTVSGLYFNNTETSYVGLFGYIGENSTVENTGVINSYFNGDRYIGGVAGFNCKGTIEKSYNTGVVNGGDYVGGVAGRSYTGTVTNCYNTGKISGDESVGGVTGHNYTGTIEKSYNTGEVSGSYDVAGVTGYNSSSTITNSYNTGKVSGNDYVGGVVGSNSDGTITNSYNTGEVSGNDYYVGGVAGYSSGTITNSYNTGEVSGNYYYVGGVVGSNNGNSTITNSYNTGDVSGCYDVGGVAGYSNGTVTNSYNTGAVSGDDHVGGVVGDNYYGTITNCYYLSDSETDSFDDTTAKTKNQFESGEVAYLLQDGVTADKNGDIPHIWGQDITTGDDDTAVDATPTLGGEKVYYGYITCADDTTACYTNNANATAEKPAHSFENGFCTICNDYEPATLNTDGCYEIANAGQLYWFADKVNNDNKNFGSANAILIADIVVNEGEMTAETENAREWTPIGNLSNTYIGTFNGNNHTVSGLYFNNAEKSYIGLFGWIYENGAVENTGVINSYFKGSWYVGGVVGINNGTITNSYNTGKISGYGGVAGVVGYNSTGIITNSYNTGEVSGKNYVGGVAGWNSKGTITNSYNTGEVSGYENVGGVVGLSSTGTITNSYNTGEVSGNYYVGGVLGYKEDDLIIITNCYYLSDSETDDLDGTTAKTKDQFESGEVAYLLQDKVTADENGEIPQVWGQDITAGDNDTTVDATPTLGGEKVYYGYVNCTHKGYANTVLSTKPLAHEYENGFCTICNDYEPATLNADGCYEIGNAGQLYWFADKVNNDNENFGSANAILTADVVVNKGTMSAKTENAREWTPIGNNTKKYTGTFNGNKHTVSGLYFNNTEINYVGLFGYIGENATVENTGVINSYFNGDRYVGGVVSYNSDGTITNSYNTGAVSGNYYVGGVVGINYGTITYCYNEGSFSGGDHVGGVSGGNYGTITNSYNIGEVSGANYVGGVSGDNNKGTIINSYNIGEVSGTSGANDYVGGVVGFNCGNGTITNSYNTGKVSGTGSYVGGVAGYNTAWGTITNSYNTGAVSGDYDVGGVVSYNSGGTITNSYNTGAVSGNYYVGGVAGCNSGGPITNSYNTGAVSGDDSVGGVVGYNSEGTITNCYYLSDSETDSFDGTTAKTKNQFASGEVAYLLQDKLTEQTWGQDINNGKTVQESPNFTGAKVYQVKNCKDETAYSNTDKNLDHKYENGKCTICGAKESEKGVSVFGDINLTLEETEDNIFTGVIELQAGTYKFNVDDNGTTLGMNYTYTDTATIDYSAGYKAQTTFKATGGRYIFTYNASKKLLKIKFKSFEDIVELTGDINVELVRNSADSTVFTGSARIDAGSYKFKINDQGTIMGFGYSFDDVVYNVEYNSAWSGATTFNATGGIHSVVYDTKTNKLTFKHAPKGLGDVRVFGDLNLPLANQGENIYSATKTLEVGTYQFRIDSLGTTVCNGAVFTNNMNGVEYKSEWKGATTFKVTAKQKFTFIFDANTNKIKILNSPIDTTKVLVAFENSNLELKSTDGVNYTATTALTAGTYTFRMDEFGVTLGYGGAYTDNISDIKYNASYSSATTLKATGGNYIFAYNVNTDTLKVTKA